MKKLTVENLRSIADPVEITFPTRGPLVLLGENNAGKSNITRAIDIMFGERWPSTHSIEDHDFHGRDSDGIAIKINADVEGLVCSYDSVGSVDHIRWSYDTQRSGDPIDYSMQCTKCTKTFVSKAIRSPLFAMRIDADRRLSYQLSYTSQWTLLSKLMHRFHSRLLSKPERKARLETIFNDLVAQFSEVSEFKTFRELLTATTDDFGQNLTYRLDIDFSAYDPSNFFRSLRIHPKLDGAVRSFDELGTGQEQILALAFSYAYAKAFGQYDGMILVIDEPESHLHPLAQQWLATRLGSLATDGLQVVLTTHSPHFVDMSRPENLVVVRKSEADATQLTQVNRAQLATELISTGADPVRTTAATVGSFYEASSTTEIKSALFSRLCVLVEGDTEALALPDLLRLVDFDPLRRGVAVVGVGGIGSLAKWIRLFTALGTPVYCIFDTDTDKTGSDAADLLIKRTDIFRALGESTQGAEIANLSTDSVHVEKNYATLRDNFEVAINTLFGTSWSDKYAESAAVVGASSKPLRARYTARELKSMPTPSAAERAIRALSEALTQKLPEAHDPVSLAVATTPTDQQEVPDSEPWDLEPPF
ncbi:ATP-dependent endonuclease [Kribbella sp. NPDC058693]|uniref:ATP-dependent nuclease n=1 Tax=Kribbella sp. NPDC058693 TaxID=3346602 RepID=UPI00364828E7